MGSVVTTIFFAEVATYYDGAKDKHPQGGPGIDVFINYDGGRYRSSRQHPRGPAVDVFINYDGGRCRSSWQYHQGVSNRCVAKNLVPVTSISAVRHLSGGHYGQHYYGRQDKDSQENIP
jgi:hypothetical protein